MPVSANRRIFLRNLAAAIPAVFGLASQARATRKLRIVALGDSLTAGYGLPANEGFTYVLEKALQQDGFDVAIVNAGVSGDTASGGLSRLDWAIGDGADGMILELGANDMLRGIDPVVTRQALDTIMDRVSRRQIKVLIAGVYASPSLGEDYKRAFDRIYPDLAAKYKCLIYPHFLEGVIGDKVLVQADGMHPNAEGVAKIVKGILPQVENLLRGIAVAG